MNIRAADLRQSTLARVRNDLLRIHSLTGEYRHEILEINLLLGFPEDDTLLRTAEGIPLICHYNLVGARKLMLEKEISV